MSVRTRLVAVLAGLLVTAALLPLAQGGGPAAHAQTSPPGTFAAPPVFSSEGLAAVVFNGGSVDEVEEAVRGAGADGAWVQHGVTGAFHLLVVDAPAFLTESFRAAFPTGLGVTAVTLKAATLSEVKYRVFARFGHVWYCDPDFYPIARADEEDLAQQRFAEVQRDVEAFNTILAHLGYTRSDAYTPAQVLAIYREWKMLRALTLEQVRGGYHFAGRFTRDDNTGVTVDAIVAPNGKQFVVNRQDPAQPPICPICLVAGALIATPAGPVRADALREGMAVWTAGLDGERVAAAVLATGSMAAPAGHEVVRLVLDDGREVTASPGHPLADGRRLGQVAVGDAVDGARVMRVERVPYAGATYDLLPSGPTGAYWADGVLLGSTLAR